MLMTSDVRKRRRMKGPFTNGAGSVMTGAPLAEALAPPPVISPQRNRSPIFRAGIRVDVLMDDEDEETEA